MRSPVEKLVLRGEDPTGHGYYGAKRGTKKHQGLDIIATPGEDVFCPIDGVITKFGQVYETEITPKFKYIEITNDTYRVRLMYALQTPEVSINQRVFECDVIGKVQDVAGFWNPKMINHIHMQVWKHGLLTDAEPILLLSAK